MHRYLHHPRVREHLSRGWKFLIAGGLGAITDFSLLNGLMVLADMDPRIAKIYSTFVASLLVFTVNKFFAFRDRTGDARGQAVRFFLAYALAYVLNVALTALLITLGVRIVPWMHLQILSNLSSAAAIGLVMFWNYFLLHSFVFRKGS